MNDVVPPRISLWRRWQNITLWAKVLIGLILGVFVGATFGEDIFFLQPVGDMFLRAFRMLIVPLIFLSLASGVGSMTDLTEMGRVGMKSFVLYLLTTAIAVTIGLAFGYIFQPGAGISLGEVEAVAMRDAPTFGGFLVNLIPINPFQAFAEANVLQIITFALLIGVAVNLAGDKAKNVGRLIDEGAEVMYKLTHMIIQITPYGVFALMAVIAAKYGLDVLLPLGKLVLVVYGALLFHAVVTYGSMVKFIGGFRLKPFFKGLFDAQLVAYSTASSSATLPVTLSCVQENLGVSKRVSSFILPLGATINMDGTALYQGVAALFVAQAFGIDLTVANGLTIILTCTLASIGSASVPGAGLVMLTMVLTSVGLPLEGIAIIAGVDRIMDMFRTAVNITGDSMVSVLVAKTEGEIDMATFNAEPEI
jgi:Na+/H+-dicarboxylate symporter